MSSFIINRKLLRNTAVQTVYLPIGSKLLSIKPIILSDPQNERNKKEFIVLYYEHDPNITLTEVVTIRCIGDKLVSTYTATLYTYTYLDTVQTNNFLVLHFYRETPIPIDPEEPIEP